MWAGPGALLLWTGCTGDVGPGPPAPSRFELRPVAGPALARLEAEIGPEPPVVEADREHVRGLATMVADADTGLRAIALEEALGLGDHAAPELARLVGEVESNDEERAAALEILGALDTARSARALLAVMTDGEPSWVRAHAAWRLGETSQDWVVPHVVLRLKYETDHDTVIWMARGLARFGNFSGIGVLDVVRTSSRDEVLRGSAGARMDEIARDAGFTDAASLWKAWTDGEEDAVFAPERSPRYDLEVWRLIAGLTAFQLRGVDDGRYVLARLGAHAASLLATALHDESVYVRVHVAQSLERMGTRAAPAGETLVAALEDPDLGPNAAAALGALRFEPAETVLVGLLAPATQPALRLAAARTLGLFVGSAEATLPALRALLAPAEPAEIRQAAGESLARLGRGAEVAALLAGFLTSDRVEPVSTEHALRLWLAAEAQRGDPRARAALEAWDAQELPADEIVPAERRRASHTARRRIVEELLGEC